MAKYVLLFFPFFTLMLSTNYYQIKFIPIGLKSIVLYTLCVIPIIFIANVGINYTFNLGYHEINNIWKVNIFLWIASFLNVVILSYLWFGEVPGIKTLIAGVLVVIAILLVS